MQYNLYPKQYTTNQGETWDTISLDFYGTPYKIKELIDCNRHLANVLVFDANEKLNIPILQIEETSTLAPWKRGA